MNSPRTQPEEQERQAPEAQPDGSVEKDPTGETDIRYYQHSAFEGC